MKQQVKSGGRTLLVEKGCTSGQCWLCLVSVRTFSGRQAGEETLMSGRGEEHWEFRKARNPSFLHMAHISVWITIPLSAAPVVLMSTGTLHQTDVLTLQDVSLCT